MKKITLLMSFLLLSTSFIFLTNNVQASDIWVGFYPRRVQTTVNTTYTIDVENKGPNMIKITKIGFKFNWMSDFVWYSGNLPVILDSGTSTSFDIVYKIPSYIAANKSYNVTVRIEYDEEISSGVWSSYVGLVNFDVLVEEYVPTYVLRIHVIDEDGNPISGAFISIGDVGYDTDENGYCTLHLKRGTYTISIEAPGYNKKTVTISLTQDTNKDVVLQKSLDPAIVFGIITLGVFIIILVTAVIHTLRKKKRFGKEKENI